MKIVKEVIRKNREKRASKHSALFENFILFGAKVLDIGAGRGFIAKNIFEKRRVDITLLDVLNFNQTDLPFILYDGKKIPFPDNSFDVCLLITVLHHCGEPENVLSEAIRVSRSKLIIIEDVYKNFWQKKAMNFLDILFNLLQLIKSPRENMPFNFKKETEWQEIFKNFNLRIVHQKNLNFFGIFPRCLFVLEK